MNPTTLYLLKSAFNLLCHNQPDHHNCHERCAGCDWDALQLQIAMHLSDMDDMDEPSLDPRMRRARPLSQGRPRKDGPRYPGGSLKYHQAAARPQGRPRKAGPRWPNGQRKPHPKDDQ